MVLRCTSPAEQVFADVAGPATLAHMIRQFDQAARRRHDEREKIVSAVVSVSTPGVWHSMMPRFAQNTEVVVVDADRDARDHFELRRAGELRSAELDARSDQALCPAQCLAKRRAPARVCAGRPRSRRAHRAVARAGRRGWNGRRVRACWTHSPKTQSLSANPVDPNMLCRVLCWRLHDAVPFAAREPQVNCHISIEAVQKRRSGSNFRHRRRTY